MSWIADSPLTVFQRFCVNVIKCGPIPRHVALIMDGNRRYATKTHVDKAVGHVKGFDKLTETLQWCRELGVTEVTVYAFSIENFKRSQDEVDALMKLATEKFHKLLDEKAKIMENGICIRIIGNLDLLSKELCKLLAEAVIMTKDNDKAFLNVAFAYTSRDEMATTLKTVVEGVESGCLSVDDVDGDLISECLFTSASPDPEVIMRTSGEVRFSDFLLWQIGTSYICFADVLWPELSIWHLLACIFQYQRCHDELQKLRCVRKDKSDRIRGFLDDLQAKRLTQLKTYLA